MSNWTPDELDRAGRADELQIASRRADGSLRPFVTIWSVREGDELYVRSAHGTDNGWFRRAAASGSGRIRSGGVEKDVDFVVPDADIHSALDAVYRTKYAKYNPAYVEPVVGPVAATATLRLDPVAG